VQPLVALTAQDLEVLTSVRELAATAQFAQFAQVFYTSRLMY
jgi:hypothetical protein